LIRRVLQLATNWRVCQTFENRSLFDEVMTENRLLTLLDHPIFVTRILTEQMCNRVGHKKPSPYMPANYVFQE